MKKFTITFEMVLDVGAKDEKQALEIAREHEIYQMAEITDVFEVKVSRQSRRG